MYTSMCITADDVKFEADPESVYEKKKICAPTGKLPD